MPTTHRQLVARGRKIVRAAPQAFIDLDVEADGPAGIGSLLSVGAISPWGDEFYKELRPTDKPGIPSCREFCENHGLERRRLFKDGIEPRIAMQELAEWVTRIVVRRKKTEAILSAFPGWYDFGHIEVAMVENSLINPFGLNGLCLQTLGLTLAPEYDWDLASMDTLPPEIVPQRPFTHHAFEDAAFQQEMHFAMVEMREERRRQALQ